MNSLVWIACQSLQQGRSYCPPLRSQWKGCMWSLGIVSWIPAKLRSRAVKNGGILKALGFEKGEFFPKTRCHRDPASQMHYPRAERLPQLSTARQVHRISTPQESRTQIPDNTCNPSAGLGGLLNVIYLAAGFERRLTSKCSWVDFILFIINIFFSARTRLSYPTFFLSLYSMQTVPACFKQTYPSWSKP